MRPGGSIFGEERHQVSRSPRNLRPASLWKRQVYSRAQSPAAEGFWGPKSYYQLPATGQKSFDLYLTI